MDGRSMLRLVRELLNEKSDSSFLNNRFTFDLLYIAAKEFNYRTGLLTATQSITTVANQTAYTLDGDFMALWLRDESNRLFIKFNDGTDDHFISFRPYWKTILHDQDTSIAVPAYFSLKDDDTLDSQISGAANADGTNSGGETTLSVATAKFADSTPGDIVHNTKATHDYHGIVTEVTSTTALKTAMFDEDGDYQDWADTDTFIIQPKGRMSLVLDPPCSADSKTITVYYLALPKPVYTDYGVYRFAYNYAEALCMYAAWLYKYREIGRAHV